MNENTLKTKMRSINLIYICIIIGLFFLGAILVYLRKFTNITEGFSTNLSFIMEYISMGILLFIPIGYFVYSQMAKTEIKNNTDEEARLNVFRNASIIKFMLFEIAAAITLFGYFVGVGKQSLMFFLIIIIVFAINKPSVAQLKRDFYDEEITP